MQIILGLIGASAVLGGQDTAIFGGLCILGAFLYNGLEEVTDDQAANEKWYQEYREL